MLQLNKFAHKIASPNRNRTELLFLSACLSLVRNDTVCDLVSVSFVRYIEVTTTLENVETKEEVVLDDDASAHALGQRVGQEKRKWAENGWDDARGRKPFAQTDLDAVMRDHQDAASLKYPAPVENGMRRDADGVILPPPDRNTFPDANNRDPYASVEAPAELRLRLTEAEPEAFGPSGSIAAPRDLNGTLTHDDDSGSDGSLSPKVLSEAISLVTDKLDGADSTNIPSAISDSGYGEDAMLGDGGGVKQPAAPPPQQDASAPLLASPDSAGFSPADGAWYAADAAGLPGDKQLRHPPQDDAAKYKSQDQVKNDLDAEPKRQTSLLDSPVDDSTTNSNLPVETPPKTPENRYPMFVAMEDDDDRKRRRSASKSPKRKGSRSSLGKDRTRPLIKPCEVTTKAIKDGNKPSTVIKTVVISVDDEPTPLTPDTTKTGSVTTKTIKTGNKTTTIVTTAEEQRGKTDKNLNQPQGPLAPLVQSLYDEDSKPGIVASKLIKDADNKEIKVTVTLIKTPGGPSNDDAKLLAQTLDGITDVKDLPQEHVKPCTITTKAETQGDRTFTTTVTVIPDDASAMDAEPTKFNNAPCKISAKTLKDGKKECLVTTTLVYSQDPEDIKNVDSLPGAPFLEESHPGTFSREVNMDGEDKVTVATTKVTIEELPLKKKGKSKNKDRRPTSETKPGITMTTKVREGGRPALLMTSLVPLEGAPKGYENNIMGLAKSKFPGMSSISEDEAVPSIVSIDSIPDGNKTTTITRVTTRETPPPEAPGQPCIVSTKAIKDGKKEAIVSTTLVISPHKANGNQIKSIPSGFPAMEDSKSGTFNSETSTENGQKITVNTTTVSEEKAKKGGFKPFKGFKSSKDKKTDTRPGVLTSRLVREGDKIGVLTTTITPVQGMPKDYERNLLDLQRTNFPGFGAIGINEAKPCTVTTDTTTDGNHTTTVITSRVVEEKPRPLVIPGIGNVPAADIKPCIVSAKIFSDGTKSTLVTTTISASRQEPGKAEAVPLDVWDINTTDLIENPEDVKHGSLVSKVIGGPNDPMTLIATLVNSNDNKPAYPVPREMARGQDKPAVVTTKTIQDGNVTTTVTTAAIPVEELPADHKFTIEDVQQENFPGFSEMPVEDTKPCSVSIEAIPQERRTVTIMTIPSDNLLSEDERKAAHPAVIDIPGFGEVPADDTKPCLVNTRAVMDGRNATYITTTVTSTRNEPGQPRGTALGWKDIDTSSLDDRQNLKPGIYVSKTVDEPHKPRVVTGTLVTSDSGEIRKLIPPELKRGQEKPAVGTMKTLTNGDVTTTVTTTMVPAQNLPEDHQFTSADLDDAQFPGFGLMNPEETKPCTVLLETVPEGDKTTTITITSIPLRAELPMEVRRDAQPSVIQSSLDPTAPDKDRIDAKPLLLDFLEFGVVPLDETKPCLVNSRAVREGDQTTFVTTIITATRDAPGQEEGVALGCNEIEAPGLEDENLRPGTFVSKPVYEVDDVKILSGTLVTSDPDDIDHLIPHSMPRGLEKPAVVSIDSFRKGNVETTMTTAMVPVQHFPEDHQFTAQDLTEGRYPGFNTLSPDNTKPGTVLLQTLPEDDKTNAVTLVSFPMDAELPQEERFDAAPTVVQPAVIDIPGFGAVPADQTQPCVVATKAVQDGNTATLVTTTITASQTQPGKDPVPLEANQIQISGLVDRPEDCTPGIYAIRQVDDPTVTLIGTLLTPEAGVPRAIPDEMKRQRKPAIATARSIQDGDITTTVTTTMVPTQYLPGDYEFTTGDVANDRFPGFNAMPVEDTKPCTVAIDTIPNKGTVILTEVRTDAVLPPDEVQQQQQDVPSPSIMDIPMFGQVASSETTPCVVTARTIQDGNRATLVTKTITGDRFAPGQKDGIPVSWQEIMSSRFVEPNVDSGPGVYVEKVADDPREPGTVMGTLVTTDAFTPSIIPALGFNKPGVSTSTSQQDGDVTFTVVTTLTPLQPLPEGYTFTGQDLNDGVSPGLGHMPPHQTNPCNVSVLELPEESKKTTITITSLASRTLDVPEEVQPTEIEIPGFGVVPNKDVKQCIVSTKTVTDRNAASVLTTTITASEHVPGQADPIPLGWKDIDPSKFIAEPQSSKPGIFATKTIVEDSKPKFLSATVVTTEADKPTFQFTDEIPMRKAKPAIVSEKSTRDGNKITTVTTTVVPIEKFPEDHKFKGEDLKKRSSAGFEEVRPEDTKSGSVTFDTIQEDDKMTTIAIASVPAEEKTFSIAFPGFQVVPTEETKPCIVEAKTVQDGNKTSIVTTTVTVTEDIPGTKVTAQLSSEDIPAKFIENPTKSSHGVIATRRSEDPAKPSTLLATLVSSEDGTPTSLDDLPSGQDLSAVESVTTQRDGNKTVEMTTTLIPVKGVTDADRSDILRLKDQGFPGFDKLPSTKEDLKPCTVRARTDQDGRKKTTVTITEIPDVTEKPEEPPAVGDIPCTVLSNTVKDGKKECLITICTFLSQDPEDINNLANLDTDVPNLDGGNPGILSQETTEEKGATLTTTTTRVTVEETPGKKNKKNKNKDKKPTSETRPGIVTTRKVRSGDKPYVVTTTLTPTQGTPKGYDESNVRDLFRSGFPGFNTVSEDQAKPCSITIDTIPDGNKTTTVTKVVSKELPAPESEGQPCAITTRTVKDGKKETQITTVLLIIEDNASKKDLAAIRHRFPDMDNAKPGLFASDATFEGDKVKTVNTIHVTEETKQKGFKGFKGFKSSKEKKPVVELRPGATITQRAKDGNRIATVTTTLVPIQGMPKGYENNILDLKKAGFPGFNLAEEDATPCTVNTETITDGNKTSTTITTTMTQDKPRLIELPGFGVLPNDDSVPCIVTAHMVQDENKRTMVTTTVMANKEIPGTDEAIPLQPKDIGFIDQPGSSKQGTITTKTIDDPHNPIVITATVVPSDDDRPAYPLPKDLPLDRNTPALITTKSIKEGDKTTTVLTTMVPLEDLPVDYRFTPEDVKEGRFAGFDSIPSGETKVCTVNVQSVPEENKASTVTTTSIVLHDKPLLIELPGLGNTLSEDAKPCLFSTDTVKDKDKQTFVSTTVIATRDVPHSDETIPVKAEDIEVPDTVKNPENLQPGICVVSEHEDAGKPRTVTATLVISEAKTLQPVLPSDLNLGQDKPATVTIKTVTDGDVTTTVLTTMMPTENLPRDYTISTTDLKENKFPGFDQIPEGETKAATVTVSKVPDGEKTATITTTSVPTEDKPLMIEFPGFGSVTTDDVKPCVVTAKTVEDDSTSTWVTTTVTASQEQPDSGEVLPLDSEHIDVSTFIANPEDTKPGTLVKKTVRFADKPTIFTGTLVTRDEDSNVYPIPLRKGVEKPAIIATKQSKKDDITTTVTTTLVPVEGVPDDYTFTAEDLKEMRFPGFEELPAGDVKTTTVKVEDVSEGDLPSTMTTTRATVDDKPLMIDFPAIGHVAAEDTVPCVVSTKTLEDGGKKTLVSTTVTSFKVIPGSTEDIPVSPEQIDASNYVESPEESRPGVCVVRSADDEGRPTTVLATLTTSEDEAPAFVLPDEISTGPDTPAVVTTKTVTEADRTTRVTTTTIPIQNLPDHYEFTTEDLRENKFPGLDNLPDGDSKSGAVSVENVPDGTKTNTFTVTTVRKDAKPLAIDFPSFGTVLADDTAPGFVAIETIKDRNKRAVISTTVTAEKEIPGSDQSLPVELKVSDASKFIGAPKHVELQPAVIATKPKSDDERTITATLITAEDAPGKTVPAAELPETAKPGVTTTKTVKDGEVTTTVTTTLVAIEGAPEANEETVMGLKDEGFPGFDKILPRDEPVKPCTVTSRVVRDGDKTTTVTITDVNESKGPESAGYRYMQNVPPSITFDILQTGIFGFDPVPLKDSQPCVIASKSVRDGTKTTLLTTTLQGLPDTVSSQSISCPSFEEATTEDAKPGIVIAKDITNYDREMTVTSTIAIDESRQSRHRGPVVETVALDKPGVIATKIVKIKDKPTAITTTIVTTGEEEAPIVIDPRETALIGFDDVPTETVRPCYVTVKEGRDESVAATITTSVVTDQSLADAGIVLVGDKEPETVETTDDVTTTVTTVETTTITTREDLPNGPREEDVKVTQQEAPEEREVGFDEYGAGETQSEEPQVLEVGLPAELLRRNVDQQPNTPG